MDHRRQLCRNHLLRSQDLGIIERQNGPASWGMWWPWAHLDRPSTTMWSSVTFHLWVPWVQPLGKALLLIVSLCHPEHQVLGPSSHGCHFLPGTHGILHDRKDPTSPPNEMMLLPELESPTDWFFKAQRSVGCLLALVLGWRGPEPRCRKTARGCVQGQGQKTNWHLRAAGPRHPQEPLTQQVLLALVLPEGWGDVPGVGCSEASQRVG